MMHMGVPLLACGIACPDRSTRRRTPSTTPRRLATSICSPNVPRRRNLPRRYDARGRDIVISADAPLRGPMLSPIATATLGILCVTTSARRKRRATSLPIATPRATAQLVRRVSDGARRGMIDFDTSPLRTVPYTAGSFTPIRHRERPFEPRARFGPRLTSAEGEPELTALWRTAVPAVVQARTSSNGHSVNWTARKSR